MGNGMSALYLSYGITQIETFSSVLNGVSLPPPEQDVCYTPEQQVCPPPEQGVCSPPEGDVRYRPEQEFHKLKWASQWPQFYAKDYI
jgi:hypothetical protein